MRKLLIAFAALLFSSIALAQVKPVGFLVDKYGQVLPRGVYSDAQAALKPTGVPALVGGALYDASGNAISIGFANPMTTGGDVIYGGASGSPTRLANGTVGQVLTSGGTTVAPTWVTPAILQLRCVSASASGALTLGGTPNKVTATCTGATTAMVASASPTAYPGDNVIWTAYVSAANTVTIVESGLATVTPVATTFQVAVMQ